MKIIGYIILFYIGFYFYRLGEVHHKNKWFWGFVGVATNILGNFIYILFIRFFIKQEVNELNLVFIGFKSFATGIIFVFGLFHLLNFIWSREKRGRKNTKITKTK